MQYPSKCEVGIPTAGYLEPGPHTVALQVQQRRVWQQRHQRGPGRALPSRVAWPVPPGVVD